MKKLYLFLISIIGIVGHAQIVNIPDANLKARLLSATAYNDIAATGYPNSAGTVYGGHTVIDTNGDGEIQVSEAAEIKALKLSSCSVGTSFQDLTGIEAFTSLVYLNINCNSVVHLNLNNEELKYIEAQNNPFQSADFSALPNLKEARITGSNLTTIDFSYNYLLTNAQLQYNSNLEYIFIKDTSIFFPVGSGTLPINIQNDTSLKYICAKETEIPKLKQYFSSGYYNGMFTNLEINSYCSFTPGGAFYNINGTTRFDANQDGCDANDQSIPFFKFTAVSVTTTGAIVSNETGNYTIPVQSGTYTITPSLEHPDYFIVSPPSKTISFPSTTNSCEQDFCLSANGIKNDLEIVMIPTTLAVPGFDASYKIIYKNTGNQVANGAFQLNFDDAIMDFVSANPVNQTLVTNSASWNFTNLKPLESREIVVKFNINSPMETPQVNGGDILDYTATIVGATDETPADNTMTLHQKVVNSFDPNDKTCLEGASITPDKVGEYVHYTIRFENTGTANAENIVIADLIDATKFDISSLVPLHGSSNFYTKITGNKVEFIFKNINLPFDDANNDGYVAFKIRTKSSLVIGDTFSNTASIYFDYNQPIVTNTTNTTVQALATQDFDFGKYFTLYPNPAKQVLNIDTKTGMLMTSVEIYNLLGQKVIIIPSADGKTVIDISNLRAGTYLVKISTNNGSSSVSKFIKE